MLQKTSLQYYLNPKSATLNSNKICTIIVVVGHELHWYMILSESEEPPTMYHRVILSLLNVN